MARSDRTNLAPYFRVRLEKRHPVSDSKVKKYTLIGGTSPYGTHIWHYSPLRAFDTVWIDGLLFKLFSELGIKGRMWPAIKDLYSNVKAKVLYAGSLSKEIDISQDT